MPTRSANYSTKPGVKPPDGIEMHEPMKPKLRQNLKAVAGEQPNTVVIHDPFHLGGPIVVSRLAFDTMKLLDGQRTIAEIHADFAKMFDDSAQQVSDDTLNNLIAGLDKAYFLESPRLHERLHLPDRPPACVGSYEADPGKLRKQLKKNLHGPRRPGVAGRTRIEDRLGRPGPGGVGAAHGLRARRGDLRLGLQGTGRTNRCGRVRRRRHFSLFAEAVQPDAAEFHFTPGPGGKRTKHTSTVSSAILARVCSTTRTRTPRNIRSNSKS